MTERDDTSPGLDQTHVEADISLDSTRVPEELDLRQTAVEDPGLGVTLGDTPISLDVTLAPDAVGTGSLLVEQGERVGRYVVLGKLGAGGMGVVYRAYDPELDRRVALKVIHPSGDGDVSSTVQARGRLLKEAQALAKISHPNVIPVFDIGEVGSEIFVAMELVQGQDLSDWLQAEERSWREILALFLRAGEGLEAAHEVGLIHRDFKPDNVLLGDDGRVRVIDFGLARRVEVEEHEALEKTDIELSSIDVPALTQAGAVMGTPIYMAPEQFGGDVAGASTDQFNFCAALFEALYGEPPHEGDSMIALAFNALQGQRREPPNDTEVPARMGRILSRGLSTRPEDRYPSMRELLDALADDPERRRRRALLIGAGVVLGLALLVVALWPRPDPAPPQPCRDLEPPMAAVWGSQTQQALRQQILATQREGAPEVWTALEHHISAYAAAGNTLLEEACHNTLVTGAQTEVLYERQRVCLDERARALRATLDLLIESEDPTLLVEQSRKVVAGLPPIDGCRDRVALMAGWAASPAPEIREAVEAAEDRLVKAWGMREAGLYAPSLERVIAVETDARELDYGPLLAETLVLRGKLEMHLSRPEDARETLFEALRVAEGARDDDMAARAWISLVFVYNSGLSAFDEAERWFEHARVALERRGDDPQLRGELLYNGALLLFKKGDYEASIARQREAIEAFQRVGEDHWRVGICWANIGSSLGKLARYEEAIEAHERAVAIIEGAFGETYPNLGLFLSNLGSALSRAGRHEASGTIHARALEIKRRHYGDKSKTVAISIANVATSEYRQGHFEKARALYLEAIAVKHEVLPEGHTSTAYTLRSLATLEHHLGHSDTALKHAERAYRLFVDKHGAEHPDSAGAALDACENLVRLGRLDEARARCEPAMTYLETKLGADHPDVAWGMRTWGELLSLEGQHDPALAVLERALDVQIQHGKDDLAQARTRLELGLALRRAGQVQRAQQVLTRSRAELEALGPLGTPSLKRIP